jgi:integrase
MSALFAEPSFADRLFAPPVLQWTTSPRQEITWHEIAQRAPQMAVTMAAYLEQLSVSARPATVEAFEIALRFFAGRVTEADPTCRSVADVGRRHVEDFKTWQAARPGKRGKSLSVTTIRHRLGLLRTFFERIIEWGYDDAPARVPIFPGDFPKPDEPLPKFLDDPTMARFMAAVTADTNQRRRLMIELLARTGMRVGELAALEDDAMVQISETFWLRIPVGKLHNDRYVPLHPVLVDLITDYRRTRGPSRSGRLVDRDDGQPFDRRTVHRYVVAVAKRAGIPSIHPHQLRHTLATQAINRGMSLEAIAALLGHRSMRMTMTYARISDRTVADEYFRVTEAVEANYGQTDVLPDSTAGANMRKLAADHRRMLGNGMCTRPVALDCSFESACERCTFFETGPQFIPILRRQRDHAVEQDQTGRAVLFQKLIEDVDGAG